MSNKYQLKAGMYLLETLTSGMYNDPLSVYREYIQNSVDSIDTCNNTKNKSVNIELNPSEKRITIFDNATGISSKKAEFVLSGIGSSNKTGKGLRGFRGIGRLGGIAFSEMVTFRTKSKGDNFETTQTWDCIKLNSLLANKNNIKMSIQELFNEVTTININKAANVNSSYFEVRLDGVNSFRNYIFDYKRVKDYISQVAPVDYNHSIFSFGKKINDNIKTHINTYNHYQILLNNKPVFKPYSNQVKVTKSGFDKIEDIIFLSFHIHDKIAAYGWYGKRKEMLGSISKGDDSSGLRVRIGNILLGDEHLLDRCFREDRFNSYLVGEIHVTHPGLIPNSRRDDFIDNEIKTIFYNEIEKTIGLPISKEIRLRSRTQSDLLNINYNKIKSYQVNKDTNKQTTSKPTNQLTKNNGKMILDNKSTSVIVNHVLNNCSECKIIQDLLLNIPKTS